MVGGMMVAVGWVLWIATDGIGVFWMTNWTHLRAGKVVFSSQFFSPSVPPVPLHLLLLVEARRPLACDLPPETQHLHPALLFALLWSTPAGAEVC